MWLPTPCHREDYETVLCGIEACKKNEEEMSDKDLKSKNRTYCSTDQILQQSRREGESRESFLVLDH